MKAATASDVADTDGKSGIADRASAMVDILCVRESGQGGSATDELVDVLRLARYIASKAKTTATLSTDIIRERTKTWPKRAVGEEVLPALAVGPAKFPEVSVGSHRKRVDVHSGQSAQGQTE